MKTITYLSFGASFSQALAYAGRNGQNEPMLKQIWDYREESTISFCGPIPKFSELEPTYECYYTYYGVENYRECLVYEELHERELCYFNESSFDLMRGFRAGRNENLKLVDSDLPDYENLDLNDPSFSAKETCGGEYDGALEILLGECVDTDFENAECKQAFLLDTCFEYLRFYQEHNAYLNPQSESESTVADDDDFYVDLDAGCRTEWINDGKLNFLENCRLNDYKFKP